MSVMNMIIVSQHSSSGVLVTVATDQELGWTEIRRMSLQICLDIPSIMINGLPVVQCAVQTCRTSTAYHADARYKHQRHLLQVSTYQLPDYQLSHHACLQADER